MGLSISFALALFLTIITDGEIKVFLAWLLVFVALMVFGGLLELWVLMLVFLAVIVIMYLEFHGLGNNGIQ
jgi:hypothetical protein